jgi:pimeloyl-ACP methyl ester carboxylesterase
MSISPRLYKSPESHAAMTAWYEAALRRLPAPYEACTVETRQGYTHVLAMGEAGAPPVVLIHGLGGCAPMWAPQIAALAHSTASTRWTPSASREAPTTPVLRRLRRRMVDTLDALGIERAGVIGLSLGGWLATRLPCSRRACRRIALLSSPGFARLRMGFYRFSQCAESAPPGRRLFAAWSTGSSRRAAPGLLQPEVEEAMMLVLRHYNLGGYSQGGRPAIRELPAVVSDSLRFVFPLRPAELRALNMPALFLVGQHETLFDPHRALLYARLHLPALRAAEMIPRAGHGLNYDQAEMVNERLVWFLQETLFYCG